MWEEVQHVSHSAVCQGRTEDGNVVLKHAGDKLSDSKKLNSYTQDTYILCVPQYKYKG